MAMKSQPRGRPRDETIDGRVMETARRHLARHGYDATSLAAIAEEAGTTRQALYRRWPSKADLATAAIGAMSEAAQRPPTDDPFKDLVRELEAFRRGVSRPDGISMVGTMLLRSTDPELVRLYRERVVAPRRERLKEILRRGLAAGLLDADADVDLATAAFTGSWYAIALAGGKAPADWSERTAALIWRGLGGRPWHRGRPGVGQPASPVGH